MKKVSADYADERRLGFNCGEYAIITWSAEMPNPVEFNGIGIHSGAKS